MKHLQLEEPDNMIVDGKVIKGIMPEISGAAFKILIRLMYEHEMTGEGTWRVKTLESLGAMIGESVESVRLALKQLYEAEYIAGYPYIDCQYEITGNFEYEEWDGYDD